MPSAAVLAIVYAILAGGLAVLLVGAVGLAQWLRLRVRGAGLDRDGVARIAGVARSIDGVERVVAPVSGEPALCVEWAVQREGGRVARRVWRPVAAGSDRVMLAVEAEGGTVRIDPADASLALDADATVPVEESADLPDGLAAAAEALENGDAERYRLVEHRLDPGDRVTATGVLATGHDSPRLRGQAVPRLVERLLAVPFVLADDGRDDGVGIVRDRAVAGFVLGLPPTLLALVLLFPP